MPIKKKVINGKAVYDVFVKGRDSAGKQVGLRRRSIATEREAKSIEYDLITELKGMQTHVRWSKWVEHFLERYRIEYRNSTYKNYRFNVEKWMNPVWNEKFIDEITPSDVHKLIFEHIKGVSDYTRRGMLKIVRRVFNMAIEEGLLTRNPAIGVRVRAMESNQLVLNSREIEVLLREAKAVQHRFYNHWTLAILTGMRSGELHALKWSDVDFVSGFISISKAWTRYNGEGPTKTAKNRVCPISAECRKFLQELKLESGRSEHVLPRLWEWDQGQQGKVIKDFCGGIGITPVTFHDLRATFITQMLNNGVALSKVMSIVGHSSLKTTQGYLRLSGKDVEGATEGLNVKVPESVPYEGKVIGINRGLT